MAAKIFDGLGGDANVTSVDYCATRLRVEVKDINVVDQKKIKNTGVPGKCCRSTKLGTRSVQFVADEIEN